MLPLCHLVMSLTLRILSLWVMVYRRLMGKRPVHRNLVQRRTDHHLNRRHTHNNPMTLDSTTIHIMERRTHTMCSSLLADQPWDISHIFRNTARINRRRRRAPLSLLAPCRSLFHFGIHTTMMISSWKERVYLTCLSLTESTTSTRTGRTS